MSELMISLVPADDTWSVINLLDNTQSFGKVVGGSILALVGLGVLIYALVKIMIKFLSDQSRDSWGKLIVAVLVGGAFMVGGITLAISLAEGGKQTIDDLGNSMVVLSSLRFF